MICLSIPYLFKFFKGCLPQIFFGPYLNTLSHILFPSLIHSLKRVLAQLKELRLIRKYPERWCAKLLIVLLLMISMDVPKSRVEASKMIRQAMERYEELKRYNTAPVKRESEAYTQTVAKDSESNRNHKFKQRNFRTQSLYQTNELLQIWLRWVIVIHMIMMIMNYFKYEPHTRDARFFTLCRWEVLVFHGKTLDTETNISKFLVFKSL